MFMVTKVIICTINLSEVMIFRSKLYLSVNYSWILVTRNSVTHFTSSNSYQLLFLRVYSPQSSTPAVSAQRVLRATVQLCVRSPLR